MTRVACLHHLEQPFLGLAEEPLRAAGLDLDERDLAAGDPLPELGEAAAIISFGGAQSAVANSGTEPERARLRAEAHLLRAAVAAEVPVLGICLGGQILAAALGAEVRRAPKRTVAWHELEPLTADDPLLSGATAHGLHWNEDVFDLPPGAVELLGPRREGVEAFRAGPCAWGLQFHPEVGAATLERWYATYGDWLAEAGVTEAEARAQDRVHLPAQEAQSARLFGAFARIVRERSPR